VTDLVIEGDREEIDRISRELALVEKGWGHSNQQLQR